MSFREIIHKILVIIKLLFFRKKTLSYTLWLLVISIIAELKAISSYEAIGLFLTRLSKNNDSEFFEYLRLIADIFFNQGSYLVLFTLICLLITFSFLKYKEIGSTGNLASKILKKNKNLFKITADVKAYRKLSEKDYSAFINNVTDQKLKQKMETYNSFNRKRGNVYKLEEYVRESKLIEELNSYKF